MSIVLKHWEINLKRGFPPWQAAPSGIRAPDRMVRNTSICYVLTHSAKSCSHWPSGCWCSWTPWHYRSGLVSLQQNTCDLNSDHMCVSPIPECTVTLKKFLKKLKNCGSAVCVILSHIFLKDFEAKMWGNACDYVCWHLVLTIPL